MEKVRIEDNSGDRDFFTIVPNYIINHSTAIDRGLYLEMKRFAGENGKCFATTETMMKRLGIARRTFKKSLDYLLKRGWIEYVGTTKGKTRPIKTYKINNIWQENSDYFKKIPPQMTVSKKDTAPKSSKIPPQRAVEEEPLKEEPIYSNTTVLQDNETSENYEENKNISEVIYSFKEVNNAYHKLFARKDQREAARRLLKLHGIEKLKKVIAILPKSNSILYLPDITTVSQLEDKWASLENGLKKKKTEVESINNKRGNVYL